MLDHPPLFPEAIRLVIWDLDETFWHGTLTEGGITYRKDHHDLVIALAERGIISAICSKNDPAEIETLLRAQGIWEYFIFPSINWTPKGPRIRAMLDQIGLRPQSTLFIDDNPMNLAQACAVVSGLNVAAPSVISQLLEAPQLAGKPDKALTRLAQYKVTEAKSQAIETAGGTTIGFLRDSQVQVFFDYDVETHLDRAIELINRTNQLNFTKNRLPENIEQARESLRRDLVQNTTDAALIHLRDRFGDYGYVGFYMTRRHHNTRRLEHFCFSCRTLNMYIEHWVYDFLNRPAFTPSGEVLTDLQGDAVTVDWITAGHIADLDRHAAAPLERFDYIFARGGCDLASLMHYFGLHAERIHEEFNMPCNGQMLRRDHSAFLMPVLTGGLSEDQIKAAAKLGYAPEDFRSDLLKMQGQRGLVFLSFWADADIPVYRHRASGLRLPYWLVGAQGHDLIARDDLRAAVAKTDVQRERLAVLCEEFEHEGVLSHSQMVARYTAVINAIPCDTPIVLMLANEQGPLTYVNTAAPRHPDQQRLNVALRQVAQGRDNVLLLDPAAQISGAGDLLDINHFKRDVYHRLYRAVLQELNAAKPA
jgi:FkbH-like protein